MISENFKGWQHLDSYSINSSKLACKFSISCYYFDYSDTLIISSSVFIWLAFVYFWASYVSLLYLFYSNSLRRLLNSIWQIGNSASWVSKIGSLTTYSFGYSNVYWPYKEHFFIFIVTDYFFRSFWIYDCSF